MKQRLFVVLIYAILFVMLCAATAASWVWRANNPALQQSDCVAVSGALTYANTWDSGDHENLDIRLRGNRIAFWVPTDNNGAAFDAATFLRRNPLGSQITVEVRKSELRQPFYAPGSAAPLIWVSGLRDANTVYYSVAQRRDWDINNRRLGLYTAIAFTMITLGFAIAVVVAKLRGVDLPGRAQQQPRRTPREQLKIGLIQLFAGLITILLMLPIHRALFPSRGHEIFGALFGVALMTIFGFFRTIIACFRLRREGEHST